MAATMSSQRAFSGRVAQKAATPARTRAVLVSCSKQSESVVQKVQTVAAAIAAAALLQASPVSAKVILEQPQLKKVFQDDGPSAPAPKRDIILPGQRSKAPAAGAPAAKAPEAKKPEVSEQGGISAQSLALPASVLALAGGFFAWSKLDDGFEEFFTKASLKDSNLLGAGYEAEIKAGGNGVVKRKPAAKTGTKKVKAAKTTAKAGVSSPLGSLFGSKDE